MQAGDDDAAGGAGGQGGPGGPGGPDRQHGPGGTGSPGGPFGPCGSASAGVAGAAGGSAGPVARAHRAPAAGGSRSQLHEFTLRVPFPSSMEAEIARRSLTPFEGPHLQAIQRELSVTGNLLVVWIAEDPGQLRISFTSFLEQLFLVVRTMQRFGPLFPTKCRPGKGA